MTDNLLDLALSLEVLEGFPGERTVDLETIDEGGNGDQAVRLDILVELVGDVLVEDDSVLGLVLDYKSISTALASSRCRACRVVRWRRRSLCAVNGERRCECRSRTLALGPLLLLLLASSCCRCLYTISSSLFLVRRPDCAEDVPFCRLCVVAED